MSLASKIAEQTPARRLSFRQWLETLEPSDLDALKGAATNPAWSNAALVRIIQDEGGTASKDTIAAWRAGVAS